MSACDTAPRVADGEETPVQAVEMPVPSPTRPEQRLPTPIDGTRGGGSETGAGRGRVSGEPLWATLAGRDRRKRSQDDTTAARGSSTATTGHCGEERHGGEEALTSLVHKGSTPSSPETLASTTRRSTNNPSSRPGTLQLAADGRRGSNIILAGLSPENSPIGALPVSLADLPRGALSRSRFARSLPNRRPPAPSRRESSFALQNDAQLQAALPHRSLFLFNSDNRLRVACHRLLSSVYFEYAVLGVIFANCIVLAIYTPMHPDSLLNAISSYGEYAVTALFGLEVTVKMIVMGGFMHKGAYLGHWRAGHVNWWHMLDLSTTLMGFISLIPGPENYQVLRTLRLLRPLASISTSPSMRILIKSLAASLQLLGNVLLLCSFMYLLYGIVGLQVWMGTFRNHCIHADTGDILDVNQVCGECPEGYTCQATELDGETPLPNPNFGVTSFDNFGAASVVVFQTLFSEGWVQVEGFTSVISGGWAKLYWVSLIVLGCFFVVNLAIGVVFASFTRVSQEERKRATRRKRAARGSSRVSAVERVVGDVGALAREKWRKSGAAVKAVGGLRGPAMDSHAEGDENIDDDEVSSSDGSESDEHSDSDDSEAGERIGAAVVVPNKDGKEEGKAGMRAGSVMPLPPGMVTTTTATMGGADRVRRGLEAEESGNVTAREVEVDILSSARERYGPRPLGEGVDEEKQEKKEGNGATRVGWASGEDEATREGAAGGIVHGRRRATFIDALTATEEWRTRRLYALITSPAFQYAIAAIIVANTCALSVVHYPMGAEMERALVLCNYAFLSAFTLEAALRIGGLGFRKYAEDSFNRFDALVVVVSWVEVVVDNAVGGDAVDFPGLTVFRALRLLRIIKLVKHWRGLSNLALVILQGLSSLTSFLVILAIFIFTFALLGMQLFSGRMCAEEGCSDPAILDRADCTGQFTHPLYLTPTDRTWGCQLYTAAPSTYNYDNAWTAFLATFQVFTGENWHLVMYAAVEGTSMWSACYFIIVVVFGHYLLLNLFLAGIVRNVVDQHETLRKRSSKKAADKGTSGQAAVAGSRGAENAAVTVDDGATVAVDLGLSPLLPSAAPGSTEHMSTGDVEAAERNGHARSSLEELPRISRVEVPMQTGKMSRQALSRLWSWPSRKEGAGGARNDNDEAWEDDEESLRGGSSLGGSSLANNNSSRREQGSWIMRRSTILLHYDLQEGAALSRFESRLGHAAHRVQDAVVTLPGWLASRRDHSLFLFSPDNRFRRACTALVANRYFDAAMIVLIIASSVLLALQNPHKPLGGRLGDALSWLDAVFTGIFVLEAAMKIVSAGMGGYLRDPWNVLDFSILFPSILSLLLANSNAQLRGFKTLRTARAIRPLRLISKSAGMQRVLRSLGRVVVQSGAIVTLLLLFWLVFAILGVELFGGKLHCCSDTSRAFAPGAAASWGAPPEAECVGEWVDPASGESVPRVWETSFPHFDNVPAAMLTLFELTTMEDWDMVLQATMDTRGVGVCPSQNANPAAALYTIAFIIFGSLFMFNLVVSSVIDEYVRSRDHGGFDDSKLSPKQVEWIDTIHTWLSTRPERLYRCPENAGKLQRALFRLVHHPTFTWVSIAAVALNTIIMMCDHFGASETYWAVSDGINDAFALLFALEAVLKIAGMGFAEYFDDSWNRLDFVLVLLSGATFAVDQFATPLAVNPTLIRVLRMFRAARILRMVKRAKGMRTLLRTFQLALPSLWHVGSVLFLVFFVFAILGMYLLGNAGRGGMIDDRVNFETFGSSMFVLFFSLTGENWPSVLHDLLAQGKWGAIPYFIAFISIAFFILLNLFLAVILDRFTETRRMEEYRLTPPDFAIFSSKWAEYDPKATLLIPATALEQLIVNLPTPLGVKGMGFTRLEKFRMLQSLCLDGYGAECVVHYHEVLFALSYRLSGTKLPEDVVEVLLQQCAIAFPNLASLPKALSAPYSQTISAIRIQAMTRGWIARRRLSQLARHARSTITSAFGV